MNNILEALSDNAERTSSSNLTLLKIVKRELYQLLVIVVSHFLNMSYVETISILSDVGINFS